MNLFEVGLNGDFMKCPDDCRKPKNKINENLEISKKLVQKMFYMIFRGNGGGAVIIYGIV